MGNCIAACFSCKNGQSMVPNPHIQLALTVGQYSTEVSDPEHIETETKIHRSLATANMPMERIMEKYYRASGEHNSVLSMLFRRCEATPHRPAMAFRPVERLEEAEIIDDEGQKKPWTYIHLGATQYITFETMRQRMIDFGKGLCRLGVKKGATLGLFEETRWEWLTAADGAWTQGIVLVTVYANLGEAALLYAIREAEVEVMLCNAKSVAMIERMCRDNGVRVPRLIYTDDMPQQEGAPHDENAIRFDEVVRLGQSTPDVQWSLPASPDDLAMIMYTSGTTGDPKGVMMTHGNLIACALSYPEVLEAALAEMVDDDVLVAYLPLAHILEFAAEHVFLIRGTMVGYSNPKTLTNSAARPHGDLQEYRPTFFVGVPRVFEAVKKAIEAKLPQDGVRRKVYDRAYKERVAAIAAGMETPYWNEKVFQAPRHLFGGRLRCIFTGSAPMSASTQEFLQVVLGCSVCQGYALTETCCGTCQRFWQTQDPNTVGGTLPCVEMKLRDVEGWSHRDALPSGEVCIRGASVTKGYYKQPAKTKEAFGEDGWFYTGDVGQWQPNGNLRLVGRVKALVKNACGEYIALEALECAYVSNELAVPNGVCIVVDQSKHYICALVLTDEVKAAHFAHKHLHQYHHHHHVEWPGILKNPTFQKLATESLVATAKHLGRRPFEFVKRVTFLSGEWTPENGALTAAMKLKRRVIEERYKEEIAAMFCD